jgi:hypothetical protein
MPLRLGLLLTLTLAGIPPTSAALGQDPTDILDRVRRLTPLEMDEVLWLARCVLSETDRPHEQRYVAWVVRNRVETQYRGDTYREVVLEPLQFSAFNLPSVHRDDLLRLNQHSTDKHWLRTLEVALDVYLAAPEARPFSLHVRHFYSPVSMPNGVPPEWAAHTTPLDAEALGVDPQRFQFYEDVDATRDPYVAYKLRRTDRRIVQSTPKATPVTSIANTTSGQPTRRSRIALSGKVARPTRPTSTRRNEH